MTSLTFAEYQQIDSVNWSSLKAIGKSPLHYRYSLTHPREDTPAMLMGRAVHCAVLEPDRFPLDYAVYRGARRAGSDWTEFEAANEGRTILKVDEYERCLDIRNAVRAHPVAAALLTTGRPEVTVEWTDAATGIACKARIDWLQGRSLVDLKTCKSVDAREFGAVAARMQYHGQFAFYKRGLAATSKSDPRPARIIAVEYDPPFDVAVFRVGADAALAGDDLVDEYLRTLSVCRRRDNWAGRYPQQTELELPSWALGEFSDSIEVLS
ncbi:MAG: PD-(D/E)XK nuclease-like domain-containing protein [Thermoleophilia bacterium]